MPSVAAKPVLRRALIVALLLAMLAVQALGAMHRVLHAPDAPNGASHGDAHGLFAGHASASDCDLFDDLATGGFVPSVFALDLVDARAEAPRPAHAGWHLAAQAAGFLARGPPSAS